MLQGDTLAPFLFIIVLDYALEQAIVGREEELGFTLTPRKSRHIPAVTVTDLDFADNIALVSNSVEQASSLLRHVERECKKVGLHLNAKKTQIMAENVANVEVAT